MPSRKLLPCFLRGIFPLRWDPETRDAATNDRYLFNFCTTLSTPVCSATYLLTSSDFDVVDHNDLKVITLLLRVLYFVLEKSIDKIDTWPLKILCFVGEVFLLNNNYIFVFFHASFLDDCNWRTKKWEDENNSSLCWGRLKGPRTSHRSPDPIGPHEIRYIIWNIQQIRFIRYEFI